MRPTYRILVVDYSAANARLLEFLLTAEGYAVRTATSPHDALDLAASWPPDLVLTELELPGTSGLDFVGKLKAIPDLEGVGVVALSATAQAQDIERIMAAGWRGFIAKPIDGREFPRQVAGFLGALAG